jgi:hypothetical protein
LFLIHSNDLAFFKVMGTMDLVPVLGKEFVIYFPVFLLAWCFITLFNVYGRFLRTIYVKHFLYEDKEDMDTYILQGRDLIERERIKKERNSRLHLHMAATTLMSWESYDAGSLERLTESVEVRTNG